MRPWATLLLPLSALASEGDFAASEKGWNGLSELCDLARGMGMTIDETDEVDLDANPASMTTLMIFSPSAAPDPGALLHFLRRGGRALIADDFGDAETLFGALGIERVPVPATPPRELYRDNPNLPVAHIASSGPMVRGVEEVVTNHPAYLRSRLPSLLAFSSLLDALAVAGEIDGGHEPGRFVALSDPSVLINNMLAFAGNVVFARNLLEWLGRPGGRLILVRHDFTLVGGTGIRERFGLAQLRREFNAFAAGLSRRPPSRELLHGLAVLAAIGVGGVLIVLLRLPRRPPPGPFAVNR